MILVSYLDTGTGGDCFGFNWTNPPLLSSHHYAWHWQWKWCFLWNSEILLAAPWQTWMAPSPPLTLSFWRKIARRTLSQLVTNCTGGSAEICDKFKFKGFLGCKFVSQIQIHVGRMSLSRRLLHAHVILIVCQARAVTNANTEFHIQIQIQKWKCKFKRKYKHKYRLENTETKATMRHTHLLAPAHLWGQCGDVKCKDIQIHKDKQERQIHVTDHHPNCTYASIRGSWALTGTWSDADDETSHRPKYLWGKAL